MFVQNTGSQLDTSVTFLFLPDNLDNLLTQRFEAQDNINNRAWYLWLAQFHNQTLDLKQSNWILSDSLEKIQVNKFGF